MIRVNNATVTNTSGKLSIMKFEFSFDNLSELPKGTYLMGATVYGISNGSTAINIKNNVVYTYNNSEWIKDITSATKPVKPTTKTNTNITENGNYNIISNANLGMSNVSVNVEGGGSTPPTLIEKTITENGDYSAVDDEADGYSSVSVDVEPTLINKNITENGEYTAITDNADGYSKVNVDVSSVGFTAIHTLCPVGDGVSDEVWLFDAPDGNYVISNLGTPNSVYVTCKTPVKRLTITNVAVGTQIVFTTDSAFEGCFVDGVESGYSDNIFSVAGSGYASYVQIYDGSSYCFTPSNPVDDVPFYETFYFNLT